MIKKVKLSEEDRCAIDLVLEQRAAVNNGDPSGLEHCFGKATASLQARVEKVTELLDLVGQMPPEEPPTNLAEKTMRFVRQHEHERLSPLPSTRRPALIHHGGAAQRSLQ
jgi:hypothetical protein